MLVGARNGGQGPGLVVGLVGRKLPALTEDLLSCYSPSSSRQDDVKLRVQDLPSRESMYILGEPGVFRNPSGCTREGFFAVLLVTLLGPVCGCLFRAPFRATFWVPFWFPVLSD